MLFDICYLILLPPFVQDGATTPNRENFDNTMSSAVRFGAMFGAGVDVKLCKTVGVLIGDCEAIRSKISLFCSIV